MILNSRSANFGSVAGALCCMLACPFCTALKPTLSQQRESAAGVALGELATVEGHTASFRIHSAVKGAALLSGSEFLTIPFNQPLKPGALVLIFGRVGEQADQIEWTALPVNETSYAYFARAPDLRQPTSERLRYFASFLEHADRLLAEDAYLEFGHAPFDEVARVVDVMPIGRMRSWIQDPHISDEHKGFYGLALGLATSAADRRANTDALKKVIDGPAVDFRAGFDGILGGYLLLAGTAGLDLIDDRYLSKPSAADGDVRHALTALRFYREFGHGISPERQNAALRHLLVRPEFADQVIADLARRQDWSALPDVVRLYDRTGYPQPTTGRAVVGYLLACPLPAAADALAEARRRDPAGIDAAEQVLSALGSARKAE